MKNRGFKEIYQIDGGIVRYGEKYGDKELWEGSLYVFDKRMPHGVHPGHRHHRQVRTVRCPLEQVRELLQRFLPRAGSALPRVRS